MKTTIFLLLGIVLAFNVNGQDQMDIIKKDSVIVFCDIMIESPAFHNNEPKIPKVEIWGDFGNGIFLSALKNEEGKKIKFYTPMGALNYMSKSGWKLVQVYMKEKEIKIPVEGTMTTEIHYIMKKKNKI